MEVIFFILLFMNFLHNCYIFNIMLDTKNEKTLVIVESPNKIKAIKKYLTNHGIDCEVEATVGHIATLPAVGKDGLGIDTETWTPLYKIARDKSKIVTNLKKIVKTVDRVVIATDHDREGEAIADNLVEYLKIKDKYDRIKFNEITESAIIEAYNNPGKVDEQLVNAQKARRMIDRIIGFKLSKLMRRNIRNAVGKPTAGRVQSIALKLVVDRENEIKAFIPVEYFNISAIANNFEAKYFNNQKTGNKEWIEPSEIDEIYNSLKGPLTVIDKNTKSRKDASVVPLKQATLYKKSHLSSGIVQMTAQKLYEGFNEDGGLITYPRTDSTRYSDGFIKHARRFIGKKFGEEFIGDSIRGSSAGAQDAHEAIRPTSLSMTPDKAKEIYDLNDQEYNVYSLIYRTTLQSIMKVPERDITSYVYENNGHTFKNSFSRITFKGYLVLDNEDTQEIEDPQYKLKQEINIDEYVKSQHSTKPAPRYTEGSLISMLDEIKVGRPSTFATTVKIIKEREYVVREGTSLLPTELGFVVNTLLTEHFPKIINEQYTAYVEDQLDLIAADNKPVNIVMDGFNANFTESLDEATKTIQPLVMAPKLINEKCPDDGGELIERRSRVGDKFIGCLNWPNCTYTRSVPKKNFYRRRTTK